MTSVTIDLSGKVALVTGGAYGMGRAAARRFASCGARVAVADVDVARGLETVEMITKDGGRALFIEADVSLSASVQDMIGRVVAEYGRLDYAHNNAGIIEGQLSIHEYPDDQWDRIIANNLDARSFITMTYAVIDLDAGIMTYARAGHTPMMYLPGPGCGPREVQVLAPDGLALPLAGDRRTPPPPRLRTQMQTSAGRHTFSQIPLARKSCSGSANSPDLALLLGVPIKDRMDANRSGCNRACDHPAAAGCGR